MKKSSHKSIYSLYKSCSILHKEIGKIDLSFFWFFFEFLCNLQASGTTQRKRRIFLHKHPWKDWHLHIYALQSKTFTGMPPTAEGARRRRCGPRVGKQVAEVLDSTHLGSVGHKLEDRGCSGERARRRPTAVAAGTSTPANQWVELDNK
jgi:hypothetical protein